MTNSGFTNNRFLSLDNTLNIQVDPTKDFADERVQSITLQQLYDDVLGHVSANIDLDLKVVNVIDNTVEGGELSILSDNKTFQLKIADEYLDSTLIITSAELLPKYPTQKDYNEYTNTSIGYLTAWTTRFDANATYDPDNSEPTDLGSVFQNVEVTAQLAHSNPGKLANAINVIDGDYLDGKINSTKDQLDELEVTLRALYDATQVTSYNYIVGQMALEPAPGQVVLETGVELINQNYIKVHSLGYPDNITTLPDDPVANPPTIANNYLLFNKLNTVLSVDGVNYTIDYDTNKTPTDGVEKLTGADGTEYYKIRVIARLASGTPDGTDPTKMAEVFAYNDSADINAALENYMHKSGLKDDGTQDSFTGEIHFDHNVVITGNATTTPKLIFGGSTRGSIDFSGSEYIGFSSGYVESLQKLNMSGNRIEDVEDPTNLQDAVTLGYLNTQLDSLEVDDTIYQGSKSETKNTNYVKMNRNGSDLVHINRTSSPFNLFRSYSTTSSHRPLQVNDKNDNTLLYVNNEGRIAAPKRKHDTDDALVDKKYVDEKVSGINGFTPGEPVAATSNSSTDKYGFYWSNNKLMFKIS